MAFSEWSQLMNIIQIHRWIVLSILTGILQKRTKIQVPSNPEIKQEKVETCGL